MRKFSLVLVALFTFSVITFAQWNGEKEILLNDYFEQLSEKNKAMGSIALMKGNEIIYANGFGYSNVDQKIAPDENTAYHVGSISKIYTSVLIHQLEERGKLSLTDKLSKYYPKVKNAEKITISDLLNHRSGIFNFTNAEGFGDIYTKPIDRSTHLKMIYEFDSVFEPGSKADYSNSNYLLLANIIEDASGKSYQDLLKKNILKKVKTSRTTFGKNLGEMENEARSYSFQEGKWEAEDETHMTVPFGAGSVRSTPKELTMFAKALFSGNLVSDNILTSMSEITEGFGSGLFEFPYNDLKGIGHNGGIDGYQSHLSHFAQEDLTFALTLNGVAYDMNEILIAVLAIYFGDDFEMPDFDSVEVAKHILESYAGTYTSPDVPIEPVLFEEGGYLKAKAVGEDRVIRFRSESNTVFHDDEANVRIEFDEEGSFAFSQGDRETQFTRKKGTSKKEIDVDKYTTPLETFTGTYACPATGQGKLTLSRDGETTFTFTDAGIVMEFDGKNSFVLKQGVGTYTFTKE